MKCYVILKNSGKKLSSSKVFASKGMAEMEAARMTRESDFYQFRAEELVLIAEEKSNEGQGTCAVSTIH